MSQRLPVSLPEISQKFIHNFFSNTADCKIIFEVELLTVMATELKGSTANKIIADTYVVCVAKPQDRHTKTIHKCSMITVRRWIIEPKYQ